MTIEFWIAVNLEQKHLFMYKGVSDFKACLDRSKDLSKSCENLDFPAHLPKNDMLLRKIKQRLKKV